MGKLLGTLAIVGAGLAAILTVTSGNAIPPLMVLFAVVTSVMLLVDRRARAVLAALVLIVLALASVPAAFTSFNIKGTDLNVYGHFGPPYVAALGLLAALGILFVEWDNIDAMWKRAVGAVVLLAAVAVFFLVPAERFGNFSSLPWTIPALLLPLAGIAAGVFVLQAEPVRPRGLPPANPTDARTK